MPVVVVHAADGLPEWLTAFGTLAAGLALPLAFVQLASLRRERLRAQADKTAAWPEEPSRLEKIPDELWWSVPLRVRNSGELPVFVNSVGVEVGPWGYNAVLALPEGESELPGMYAQKVRGAVFRSYAQPGVVAPGATWALEMEYRQDLETEDPQVPRVAIAEVVVTDSAGRRWRIRPGRGGPARRVRRWPFRRDSL